MPMAPSPPGGGADARTRIGGGDRAVPGVFVVAHHAGGTLRKVRPGGAAGEQGELCLLGLDTLTRLC